MPPRKRDQTTTAPADEAQAAPPPTIEPDNATPDPVEVAEAIERIEDQYGDALRSPLMDDDTTAADLNGASLAGLLGDTKALGARLDAAESSWTNLTESINRTTLYMHDRVSKLEVAKQPPTVAAIYAAMWGLMNDVQGVGKHGQMDPDARMGNYKYRRYDDLKREVGAACRTHGVMLQSDVVSVVTEHPFKDERKTRVQVHMRYRFTSLQDGSTVTFESLGESIDTSDKATGKAQTMALKTALDQALMLAAEDIEDPDATRPNEDPDEPTREQRQARRDDTAQRQAQRDYAVGDTVTVADQTFIKHSDGPGFPNDRPKQEGDPWDQGPPKDTRTDEEKAQAAADKVSAPGVSMADWSKISDAARQMGLYEVPVKVNGQEMALKHHLVAVGRTLA